MLSKNLKLTFFCSFNLKGKRLSRPATSCEMAKNLTLERSCCNLNSYWLCKVWGKIMFIPCCLRFQCQIHQVSNVGPGNNMQKLIFLSGDTEIFFCTILRKRDRLAFCLSWKYSKAPQFVRGKGKWIGVYSETPELTCFGELLSIQLYSHQYLFTLSASLVERYLVVQARDMHLNRIQSRVI